MKIAIPIVEGKLSLHFGHCSHFALVDVDDKTKKIGATTMAEPPPHEPGVCPNGCTSGQRHPGRRMGTCAQQLFQQNGIQSSWLPTRRARNPRRGLSVRRTRHRRQRLRPLTRRRPNNLVCKQVYFPAVVDSGTL